MPTETGAVTMNLSLQTLDILKETAKWTKFLAIVGYISVGFIVLAAFALIGMGSMLDSGYLGALQGGFVGVIYLLMALLYFFPVHYLFQFSSRMKKALDQGDEVTLGAGFDYLKKHYKFIGVLTIIMLSCYALMFIFAIMAGMVSALFS